MYKRQRRECDLGDKDSVGDNGTIKVAVTVGVEKCDGKNKVTRELNICIYVDMYVCRYVYCRNTFDFIRCMRSTS